MNRLVSVVIPTYNTPAAFLREAIDSALGQSYRPLEVVVVDDGSTDDMEWVPEAYGGRLTYLRKSNGGPASARNAGIRRAAGDYLAFLDADDCWEPEKVALQMPLFERAPDVGLVYARIAKVNEQGASLPSSPTGPLYAGRIFHQLFMNNFIPACTVMVRRRCMDDVGLFDETPALISVEDYDLWLRLAERYDAAYVDRPLARYRVRSGSVSRDRAQFFLGERLVVEKAIRAYGGRHPLLVRRSRTRLGRLCFDYGYDLLAKQRYAEARTQLGRSLRYAPWDVRTGLYFLAACAPRMTAAVKSFTRRGGGANGAAGPR